LVTPLAGSVAAAGDGGYGVMAKWSVAGSDKWDYLTVDPAGMQVLVAAPLSQSAAPDSAAAH
jgi:hypothetical protein